RSLALCRHARSDLVEEVCHNLDVTLGFPRFGALRRHQYNEALAVGGEVEIHCQAEVRNLLSDPYPRPVRYKPISLHRVTRHQDPLFLRPIAARMCGPRPD